MDASGTRQGAILVLAGMAIIGLIDNFVVEVAKYSGLWQFHFVRALMAIPMLIFIGLFWKQALLPQRYWAVGLRALLLGSAMLLYFGSIPSMMGAIGLVVLGRTESADFLSRGWVEMGTPFLGWTLLQAAGSILGVGLLTRAYQTTETTYLVVFEYSLLLFASFWAFVLYGQTVGFMAALGCWPVHAMCIGCA